MKCSKKFVLVRFDLKKNTKTVIFQSDDLTELVDQKEKLINTMVLEAHQHYLIENGKDWKVSDSPKMRDLVN